MYDVIIAIDPGVNGAIAVIRQGDVNTLTVYECPSFSIKKTGSKTPRSVSNPVGMADLLKNLISGANHPVVVIEKVHARENDSKVSAFSFGENYGMWQGIIGALKLPHIKLPPATWKASLLGRPVGRLPTSDIKERSRQKCIELIPHLQEDLKFKKDHNKAEAALIAYYFLNNTEITEKTEEYN